MDSMAYIRRIAWKLILSIGAYYVLPLALLGIAFFSPGSETFSRLGSVAMILLGIILFLKPLSIISGRPEITFFLQFRRQMGVATFWLALFHGAGFIVLYDLFGSKLWFDLSYHYVYGGIALVGIVILAMTSNDYSVRLLKKNWKRVQMLAYPVLFLAMLHATIASDSYVLFTIVSVAYICAKWWEYKEIRGGKG